jgi:hypothetical protein
MTPTTLIVGLLKFESQHPFFYYVQFDAFQQLNHNTSVGDLGLNKITSHIHHIKLLVQNVILIK